MPILTIVFSIFFAVVLFYFPSARKKIFFSECKLNQATHLFVVGEEKGATELVKLKDLTNQIKKLAKDSTNPL